MSVASPFEPRADLARVTLSVLIFSGPVVLAVAHTLLDEWVAEADLVASDDACAPAEGATLECGGITKTNIEPAQ